jgi:hypothetical protein
MMIDQHFKLERAQEEIQRLNIEIPRVITYIRDEDIFLRAKESEVREHSPGLACQIEKYRQERGRYNERHLSRFRKLASLPGFTGSIKPGVSVDAAAQMEVDMPIDDRVDDRHMEHESYGDVGEDDGDDDDDDGDDVDIRAAVAALILLTIDGPHVQTSE